MSEEWVASVGELRISQNALMEKINGLELQVANMERAMERLTRLVAGVLEGSNYAETTEGRE